MSKRTRKERVYIVDGLRTIVGAPYKSLKRFEAVELAVMKELVHRNKIRRKDVCEVILGNAVSAGIGQNFSRQAVLYAGLPEEVVAFSVNNVCGAGLQSIVLGAQLITSYEADCVIAGGGESATHCPSIVQSSNLEKKIDTLLWDGLSCRMTGKNMGELAEGLAEKYKISRAQQDAFSLESHKKAIEAQKRGAFSKETVYLDSHKKDDCPRRTIGAKDLEKLLPVFKKGGTITAANSSTPCDGAACVLLASESFLRKRKTKPKACIVGYSSIALKPDCAFEANIKAIQTCLKKCRLNIGNIDLFEIGEAFAAPILLAKSKCKVPESKLNIYGGDLALGHPLGAAGARIVVTLVHALEREKKKRGLACISYGGGGALAILLETI